MSEVDSWGAMVGAINESEATCRDFIQVMEEHRNQLHDVRKGTKQIYGALLEQNMKEKRPPATRITRTEIKSESRARVNGPRPIRCSLLETFTAIDRVQPNYSGNLHVVFVT